ncbi:4-oxalocrotonate tautomerase family enzyme [Marinobacter sp. es.048]|uniref:nuclear transport factor 2 family protein n=1 Tax=Marinobacter sp. es.048 TaxID=1761795 RepID=UPI000B58D082|nr:nuclear transport factor 2 family protein [Marinobacter sp. es.048]SNC64739.1 4-oxalocrotonate tautomerase family enzyme [Marinobacter sp. es.048]
MPMLQVNLLRGYNSELKSRLSRVLTAVISGITRAKPETISVWIDEFDSDNYSRGGQVRQPGPGAADPETLVRDYLTAMEQRELDTARRYLSEDFVMTFPGSGDLTSLNQLVEWSKGRYRFVKKTVAAVNVAYEMGEVVVFVNGTLSGEWPDGAAFDSVRFIDRFEIRDDHLVRQDVWNDLANAQA